MAIGIKISTNPDNKAESAKSMAQALSLAALGAAGMGVSGKAIMTNQSMFDVAKDYVNKAISALSLNKEDVDKMDNRLAKKTILSTLNSSGLHLPALFADNSFIDTISNSKEILDGSQKVTPEIAHNKLNNFYVSLSQKDHQSADFFKKHFYNPENKSSNINQAKSRLTYLYAFQKMYSTAGITNRASFLRQLQQSDGRYPKIDQFKQIES